MIYDVVCKDCGAAFQWERFAAAGRPRTRCDACRGIYPSTYKRKILTGEPVEVNGVKPTSRCPTCGIESAYDHTYCDDCKPLDRRKSVRLSKRAYADLFEDQNGRCAICGNPPGKRALHIDHNHETGQIRGLLCFKCNVGIAMFQESLRYLSAASEYVRIWNS